MSKSGKVITGILTFLPILLFIAFFASIIRLMFHIIPADGSLPKLNPNQFMMDFLPLFMLIVFLSLLTMGLMIFYIIHAVNNKTLVGNERLTWILLFVFVGLIAFPIYWYTKILKDGTTKVTVL